MSEDGEGFISGGLNSFIAQKRIESNLSALMAELDAQDIAQEQQEKIGLWMNGPAYCNREESYRYYGSNLPILCFLSVEGSEDIWAAFQTQEINGKHHEAQPALILARLDTKEGRFLPITQRKFMGEEERDIDFETSDAKFLSVHLSMDGFGKLIFKPEGSTNLHILANPEARVREVE